MKGLTSKEHLFLRVISVVILMNAAVFYAISRNLQTFDSDVFEAAAWITVITVFVLTVHLLFWWRYQRRTDNLRFWRTSQPTKVDNNKNSKEQTTT